MMKLASHLDLEDLIAGALDAAVDAVTAFVTSVEFFLSGPPARRRQ